MLAAKSLLPISTSPMRNPDECEKPFHVFVYGTLRRGQSNDITLLEPAPEFVAEASVGGVLYCMGWYPGLVLSREGEVRGEVYRIDALLERELDQIEGLLPEPTGEYFKRTITVAAGGQNLECLLYEVNPSFLEGGMEKLAEGDWCLFHAARFAK